MPHPIICLGITMRSGPRVAMKSSTLFLFLASRTSLFSLSLSVFLLGNLVSFAFFLGCSPAFCLQFCLCATRLRTTVGSHVKPQFTRFHGLERVPSDVLGFFLCSEGRIIVHLTCLCELHSKRARADYLQTTEESLLSHRAHTHTHTHTLSLCHVCTHGKHLWHCHSWSYAICNACMRCYACGERSGDVLLHGFGSPLSVDFGPILVPKWPYIAPIWSKMAKKVSKTV